MTSGQRLKFMRKQQGWTQEELANELGVTRTMIYKYETDALPLNDSVTEKLAKIFNSSSFLLDENNWSHVPLKTERDIIGVLIELIKKGVLVVNEEAVNPSDEKRFLRLRISPAIASFFLAVEDYRTIVPESMRKGVLYNDKGTPHYSLALNKGTSKKAEWDILTWYFQWQKDNYDQAEYYELKFATNLKCE